MKAAEGTTSLAAERSGVVAPMIGVGAQAAYRHLWVELFFKGSEHRKVTIFLGLSIMLDPVIGSRPLRSFFVLTQNLPNPLIRTSSPEARLGFDQFEKDFDQFNCLIPWISVCFCQCAYKVVFCVGHR
jgi:hypothetical protein